MALDHLSSDNPVATRGFITVRAAELVVASFTALVGAVVMRGSYEQGIGWEDTGPQSGYFPFYIGLFMLLASLGTIGFTLRHWRALARSFVERGPFRHVMSVFLPVCVYGVAIRLLGMYLASLLFIGWFMWRADGDRRHARWKIVVVPLAVVVASYLIFERWFQVPLYAGPLLQHFGVGQ
jgi:hypothetical protein